MRFVRQALSPVPGARAAATSASSGGSGSGSGSRGGPIGIAYSPFAATLTDAEVGSSNNSSMPLPGLTYRCPALSGCKHKHHAPVHVAA